jgi:hypothetical protein
VYGNPRAWPAIGYPVRRRWEQGTDDDRGSAASEASDPLHAGLASGWKVIDASTLTQDRDFEADVAIVGTGAGGGTAAEILTRPACRW